MKTRTLFLPLAALIVFAGVFACTPSSRTRVSADDIAAGFAEPDDCYRPYVRWWWNGDRVQADELVRELHVMKDAGIGGVEISPISFPSGADTLGIPALTWLSDEWIACLQTVFDETKKLGMGCDLLIGSGWPFGSESLKPEERASVLIATARPLEGGSRCEIPLAEIIREGNPAVTIVNKEMTSEPVSFLLVPDPIDRLEEAADLMPCLKDSVLAFDVPEGKYQLHLDNMANTIEASTGPLSGHLRAFFVDNMELEGCNWTSDFAEEFKARRGYDIMPWFPFIMFRMGRLGDVDDYTFGGAKSEAFQEQVDRVRYDFEITRMELNYERYTRTFLAWCREKGVKSRAQA